ncbi:MAG TPA: LLM class flavin-dependent oxidoreductase [Anaerolineales bacterium]|nr:LLM class flavin-dependent oxidoreductase [Anaerolineales bacterium]HLO28949.1 LLM class flavin-dependent oxidoreductase [Anaerolineales bacterium]
MMTQIHFGFTMPADQLDKTRRTTFVEDLNRALRLISGHFDSAWIIDHLQSGEADVLEGFTALTYMAALHPQLKFGHTVLCQSFRNPALVAKMGATLQFLSGGRFILGMGAGWNAEEYRAYGYDFPPPHVRVEQLAEALQVIKALWTMEQATFKGRYYRISEAFCEPKPNALPPIMVGAFKPKMLRLTAQYADWWNVSSTGIEGYGRIVKEYERACLDVGRDPREQRRSWCGGCACAPTQSAAAVFAGDRYSADNLSDDFGFVGTPRQVVEQMRPFIDLGIDYFMLDCGGFPDLTTLELLVNEVLPALNA